MTPTPPAPHLEAFEYPSPEVVECPFAFYRALRDEAPVHRLADGTFVVSRWADIAAVVRDTAAFSNRIGPLNDQILGGPRVGGDDDGPWPLPFTDGTAHRAQRSFAASLVVRSRLTWFEPRIIRLTDELIDGFAGAGAVEFRAAFAAPLPRRVMMEAFGFPRSDEPDLIRWTSGHGPVGSKLASAAEQQAEQERRLALADYMRAQIAERREHPTDDYLTEIVQAQEARDGALDMPYLLAEIANLFAAGNHTTAHMIASTMLLALEHPETLARVQADRSLLGALLEESMRLEAPVQWLQRIATRETLLAGVTIPAGSIVLVMWGAANRDEREFPDPERLDLDRPALATRQMAFGFGKHRCIGAPLARLEGRIAFDRLLDRLPNLRLAQLGERAHIPNMNQRAPEAVAIEFDPHEPVTGLREKVAVVTGGGSGIGAATVRLLVREGARVAILDVEDELAQELADAIVADGGDACAIGCDVADEGAVAAAIASVVQRYGSLSVLVNNAGISPPGGPVDETDVAVWERVLRVNLGGCFLCSKHAVAEMKKGGGGAIVNLASVAGLTGVPFLVPYAASKHGVVGITRTLAVELAEHGIRVNAVAPGMTDTPMLRRGAGGLAAQTVEAMERHTPLRRFGSPEEIAATIVFLAGAQASFITGVVVPVDGGSVAGRVPPGR